MAAVPPSGQRKITGWAMPAVGARSHRQTPGLALGKGGSFDGGDRWAMRSPARSLAA